MREKRLVTFRIAPKKSKHQGSEKEATMADGWKKSKLSESVISSLVSHHLLQSKALIQWQSAEVMKGPLKRLQRLFFLRLLLSVAYQFRFAISCEVFFSFGDSTSPSDP
jgi:hypothetical protein